MSPEPLINAPPFDSQLAQYKSDDPSEATDRIHDLDTTVERSPLESAPLSNLPFELRDQIYGYIFHDHTNAKECKGFHLGLGNLGCRCGKGLSLANYLFYNETRARYYRCARFVFTRPEACKKFLSIGRITKFMGNLSIAYKDEYEESWLLRLIFNDLINSSSLQTLHIRVKDSDATPRRRRPPTYMPSEDKAWKAMKYDMTMRPERHPLAKLNCLRSLVIQGQPGAEVEEAIHKLSLKVETIAKYERKALQTKAKYNSTFYEWFYEVKIIDPEHEDAIFEEFRRTKSTHPIEILSIETYIVNSTPSKASTHTELAKIGEGESLI
ncbi:uncharacterized protein PAC_01419 [Phialocephala subalpina]|uniref:Uncharacterized protein n=1 Tax=Phialocephala subalpina TaxID=576137 RepID=A0A1L7WFJ4_9HELO|nr:uncharacterized protein PAC_01419 [Phialocephala subalpina]